MSPTVINITVYIYMSATVRKHYSIHLLVCYSEKALQYTSTCQPQWESITVYVYSSVAVRKYYSIRLHVSYSEKVCVSWEMSTSMWQLQTTMRNVWYTNETMWKVNTKETGKGNSDCLGLLSLSRKDRALLVFWWAVKTWRFGPRWRDCPWDY